MTDPPVFLEAIPYIVHALKMTLIFSIVPLLIFLYLRGRFDNQCLSCGYNKIRAAHPTGVLDYARFIVFLRPHRCDGCGARFYAIRFSGWNLDCYTLGRRKGVVSIVFKRHNGRLNGVLLRRVFVHDTNLYHESKKRRTLARKPALLINT